MSGMDSINEQIQPDGQDLADPAQTRAKRVFFGLAATIIVGLTLAGWYVGGRIFTTENVHAATPPKAAPVVPAQSVAKLSPAPVVTQPVAVETKPVTVVAKPVVMSADAPAPAWNTIDPQSGELYLQLAAMGPNSTNDYLKILDAKGIHPKIAPGPSENLHRILIGPYPDKAALESEQRELGAAGIQFMARRY